MTLNAIFSLNDDSCFSSNFAFRHFASGFIVAP